MKRIISFVAVVVVIITAATIMMFKGSDYRLVLRDAESGRIYASFKAKPGDEFSVEFIHSVNKSPVRDIYTIGKDKEIYVTSTVYYGFGAGVQTEIAEGETLEYKDGAMIVGNINKQIPYLAYFVGTVSDHTMRIFDEEISLRELCGKNSNVVFEYEWRLF